MSEREIDDIEFDFFDEPAEEETTQRRRAVRPGRGPRGPRRSMRPPGGLTPLVRLVGLIAAAILVVVLLVFWIQGCQSDQKTKAYKSYIAQMTAVASASQQDGRTLNEDLTTPGIKLTDLVSKLNGLAQQEQQNADRAAALDPPGHLREANQHAIEALQFRVNGLRGLADALRTTASSKDADRAGALLAQQAQRLVTSDVVWDDLFKTPAVQILDEQGVHGVAPPASTFVQNPDLASSRTLKIFFQRIHGAASGGTPTGLHGTGLVSVVAQPGGQALSTDTDNRVVSSINLAFDVTVKDTGDSQEVQIPVTITIQKPGTDIVKKKTIDVINPGETKTVTFGSIDTTGAFGVRSIMKVQVKGVRGEKNTANNSASYPIIFSLQP
jgi:hypothetical protein